MSHLVLGNYAENHIRTWDLCRDRVDIKYVQEKGYCEILVSLCMLFVHLFVHTKECDRSTHIGVEPIFVNFNYPHQ